MYTIINIFINEHNLGEKKHNAYLNHRDFVSITITESTKTIFRLCPMESSDTISSI